MSNILKLESSNEKSHTERQVLSRSHVAHQLDIERANAEIVAEVNGRKVTRGELKLAFELVEDDKNWKNPIDITIDDPGSAMISMIDEAVLFFTGARPIFEYDNKNVRVHAAGYYLSIGA